jgi:hypothetical protein
MRPFARLSSRNTGRYRSYGKHGKDEVKTAIEQGVPMLADARVLVDRFHAIIRKKAEIELEPWIDESQQRSRPAIWVAPKRFARSIRPEEPRSVAALRSLRHLHQY